MARRGMSKSRATFYTGLVIIIVTFGITIYAQWNEISDAFGWNEAEYVTYAEGDPVVHFVNSRDRPASAQNAARSTPAHLFEGCLYSLIKKVCRQPPGGSARTCPIQP